MQVESYKNEGWSTVGCFVGWMCCWNRSSICIKENIKFIPHNKQQKYMIRKSMCSWLQLGPTGLEFHLSWSLHLLGYLIQTYSMISWLCILALKCHAWRECGDLGDLNPCTVLVELVECKAFNLVIHGSNPWVVTRVKILFSQFTLRDFNKVTTLEMKS